MARDRARHKGIVSWFSPVANFGFVNAEDGQSYFLHGNDLDGMKIEAGDSIEFGLQQAGTGPCVANVHRLIESTALI